MKIINKIKSLAWFIFGLSYVLMFVLAVYYTLDFILFG